MFRTSKNKQIGLFEGIHQIAGKKKSKILSSDTSMHNIFFAEVTSKIDEAIFSALYTSGFGRPNASIRVLVAMMILKEGEGWSDAQLFDACRFDLRIMLALGLGNISDDIPSPSTYYQFKVMIEEYEKGQGDNLLDKCFKQLTLNQLEYHGVSGQQVRLDSKLLQSNISKNSRLALLLEGLRKYIVPDIEGWIEQVDLTEQEIDLLRGLENKKPHRILYRMVDKEQKDMLEMVGYVYQKLAIVLPQDSVIGQLFNQHFKEEPTVKNEDSNDADEDDTESLPPVEVKKSAELRSDHIQSIHDQDATYRKKNDQSVHGYHIQVTETCGEDNNLNLIVDVSTHGAHENESGFLQETIEQTNALLEQTSKGQQVQTAIADGGYHSNAALDWADTDDAAPQIVLTGTKGAASRYEMRIDEDDYLHIKDLKTQEECKAYNCSGNEDKIWFINSDGQRRYYTWAQVDINIRKQTLAQCDDKHYKIRANVESTIHQVFCKLGRRGKTRYRGKIRNHFYVLSRAIWTNFRRIEQNLMENRLYLINLIVTPIMKPYITELIRTNMSASCPNKKN